LHMLRTTHADPQYATYLVPDISNL